MKKMQRTLACLIYIFACTGTLRANASGELDLMTGQFDWSKRANRLQIAISLENSINKVVELLPIQKPEEINWVREESAALDRIENKYSNPRYLKLYNSTEFRHLQLKNHLSSISSALACIRRENININIEMYCWNVLSLGAQDTGKIKDNFRMLIQAGRLSKDVEKIIAIGNDTQGHGYYLAAYGNGIQEYLISPFLASLVK
jgi:hypothetical protein